MTLIEGLRTALAALAANKLRSALTTLGVVIGVGAVIAMVALGEGAQRDIQARINKLGSNLLFLAPGQAQSGMIFRAIGSADIIRIDDTLEMKANVPEVAGVAPEIQRNVQVKAGTKNGDFRILGTFADYSFVRSAELVQGRFFTSLEQQGRRNVCVIGSNVHDLLFNSGQAVGKRVRIRGIPFTVVGVMAARGGFGRDDDNIMAPLSTVRQRLVNTKYVRVVAISGREGVSLTAVEDGVRRYMRRRLRQRPGDPDKFSIQSQADILSTMQETNQVFKMLLAGIASISLLVGGIGIMNIMLVTVTERTREIGIRKALGAKRRDIQLQFLVESTVLSVLGGVIGVTLGIATAWVTEAKFGLTTVVTLPSVVLAFGCAAGIGIVFGFYPANEAAKLDPIQALRYE